MDYILKDIELENIEIIKELWEENRKFHENISEYFSYQYKDLTFEDRMKACLEERNSIFKVTGASVNSKLIGYALSSIYKQNGEVLTLYILEEFRKLGIAGKMLNLHKNWFKENNCVSISVFVSVENKIAQNLYNKIGFENHIIKMEIPKYN